MVEGEPPYGYYASFDPLLGKMADLDDLLRRFNLHERSDYSEIRSQLRVILLQQDRLANARWAVSNLEYRTEVKPAPPAVNPSYDPKAVPGPNIQPFVVPRAASHPTKKKKAHLA
eukprot:tig00000113_g5577.t1